MPSKQNIIRAGLACIPLLAGGSQAVADVVIYGAGDRAIVYYRGGETVLVSHCETAYNFLTDKLNETGRSSLDECLSRAMPETISVQDFKQKLLKDGLQTGSSDRFKPLTRDEVETLRSPVPDLSSFAEDDVLNAQETDLKGKIARITDFLHSEKKKNNKATADLETATQGLSAIQQTRANKVAAQAQLERFNQAIQVAQGVVDGLMAKISDSKLDSLLPDRKKKGDAEYLMLENAAPPELKPWFQGGAEGASANPAVQPNAPASGANQAASSFRKKPGVILSCVAEPKSVVPGDEVRILGTPDFLDPKRPTYFTWSTTGGTILEVNGMFGRANVDTQGLAPGTYTVTGHVSDGTKPSQMADCTASFVVTANK